MSQEVCKDDACILDEFRAEFFYEHFLFDSLLSLLGSEVHAQEFAANRGSVAFFKALNQFLDQCAEIVPRLILILPADPRIPEQNDCP